MGAALPSGRLRGRWIATAKLSADQRHRMWQLFSLYYTDVTETQFQADLAPKNHVILLEDTGSASLEGFSTLQVYRRAIGGRNVRIIYSGDTIVTEKYWGQPALQRTFVRFLVRERLKQPWGGLYWFLITKGYKTYLLLSRNFPDYYPHPERATPAWEKSVIDTLAQEKFGQEYNPESGVVCFRESHGKLREGVAPVEAHHLSHADIRFFVEKNPGHGLGHELCCLGKVHFGMFGYFLRRQLLKGARALTKKLRAIWGFAAVSS